MLLVYIQAVQVLPISYEIIWIGWQHLLVPAIGDVAAQRDVAQEPGAYTRSLFSST